MKYFRIGYCPPNPGPWSRIYEGVHAYNETEIDNAIKRAKEKPNYPIYMKPSYGKRYREITFDRLLEYAEQISSNK